MIATDTDAVYQDWGIPEARAIAQANPVDLEALCFPAGSMGPKVAAAVDFAIRTGQDARIGALTDLSRLLDGTAGTRVSTAVSGLTFR